MGALPAGGAMAAIEATEEEVAGAIEGREAELAIAAINGPTSTRHLRRRGGGRGDPRRTGEDAGAQDQAPRRLPRLPLAADGADAGGVRARSPQTLTYSEPADPDRLQPQRRAAHRRAGDRPRLLGRATSASRCASPTRSRPCTPRAPPPTWSSAPTRSSARWRASASARRPRPPSSRTLREGRPEAEARSPPRSPAPTPPAPRSTGRPSSPAPAPSAVPLPTYPFQRQRYWLASASGGSRRRPRSASARRAPAAGGGDRGARGRAASCSPAASPSPTHPWLADHAVAGSGAPARHRLPRAGPAGRRAGRRRDGRGADPAGAAGPPRAGRGRSSRSRSPAPTRTGRREIAIHSRPEGERGAPSGPATRAASSPQQPAAARRAASTPGPPQGAEPIELEDLYDRLAEAGLEYGPAFQGLSAAWRDGEEIYAEVSLPRGARPGGGALRHPPGPARRGPARASRSASGGTGDRAALRLERGLPARRRRRGAAGPARAAATEGVSLALADGAGAPLGRGRLAGRCARSTPSSCRRRARARRSASWSWAAARARPSERPRPRPRLCAASPERRAAPPRPRREADPSAPWRRSRSWLADEPEPTRAWRSSPEGAVAAARGRVPRPRRRGASGAWSARPSPSTPAASP